MTSAFAEPGRGVEHLVEVRERQLPPIDLDEPCPLAISRMHPMPSAIWTGSISFGLVQVPVRLVGATKSKDVSFNQLEEGTGARIRYKKVSDATGEEVPPDKIKRGYEISKGRYVMIEPDELDVLKPKGSHAIEIEEFVDLDEIDPAVLRAAVLLAARCEGHEAVQVARRRDDRDEQSRDRQDHRALEGTARCDPSARRTPRASRRCVTPTRCCRATRLVPEDVELTDRERTMARQLVESLAVDEFLPEKFRDEYREQVLDLIETQSGRRRDRRRARRRSRPPRCSTSSPRSKPHSQKADTAQGTAPERRGRGRQGRRARQEGAGQESG